MSAIEWKDVLSIASELSTVDLTAQAAILNYVNTELDTELLGGEESFKLRMIRMYLAAHLGTFAMPGSGGQTAGPIISKSEGGVSVTYANLSSGTSVSLTSYGKQYISLIRSSGARGPFLI